MKRTIFVLVGIFFILAAPAFGQVVAQGQPGVTSDARAWPFKIVFGGAQIDPRDVSDRGARLLGKVTFDGAQPVTQSGAWSISFTAAQHIICDSGCGSPAVVADSQPFVFGTQGVGVMAAVVDDVGTNTVAENSYGAPRMTTNRELLVKCNVGCTSGVGYFESAANSTTTLLLAGATFTGTYESTLGYGGVRIMVGAAFETGTLFLDWSTDGVNLDAEDSYPTVATIGTVVQVTVKAKWFRVKYTENGAQNQSSMRLQTAYMTFQTPDVFDTLLAPTGAAGSVAPWTSRSLVVGGQNLSGGAGAGVTAQRFIFFPWSDAAMSDGTYNVQLTRTLPGEGDGYAARLIGTGSPVTGYFPIGGAVADAQAALAQSTGGEARMTPFRALHGNLRNALGTEIASSTTTPGATDLGLVARLAETPPGAATDATLALINAALALLHVDNTQPGPRGLPLPLCNAVRRRNCSPKGY